MLKGKLVSIESYDGNYESYIIKDKNGNNIGDISIIEMCKASKSCCFRLILNEVDNNEYTKDILKSFLNFLFNKLNVLKVNILVREDMELQAYVDANMQLEGIVSKNVFYNNEALDEFLFGIDYDTYRKFNVIDVFRLTGNNIELKVLTPQDSQQVVSYVIKNREHLKDFEPERSEGYYTLQCQKKIIVENYNQFLNGKSVPFGIFKSNNLIGKIQISNIVLGIFRNAFIGYSMDEDEQGKGYMKEAINLVLGYAFKELELNRIEASTLVNNVRSQAVLKSCGFEEIGVSKKYLYINNSWRDHRIYNIIKEDWDNK